MSLFTEKDWNELIYAIAKQLKPKEAAVANKGQQFEIVVEELLHILFEDQDLSFTPTKMSYDGSKDFWSIDDSYKLWWVECKNYRENISLTQLAPTLFMADLHEASYLLFFSHSKLNRNIKRKIGIYAEKHHKEIFVFEDEYLDCLIINCFYHQSSQFQYKKSRSHSDLEICMFDERCPLLTNLDNFSGYYEIEELTMGEIYHINALIINHSLVDDHDIQVTIVKSKDIYHFEFLTNDNCTEKYPKCRFKVKPCQIKLVQFAVRLIKPAAELLLPRICLTLLDSDQPTVNSPQKRLACSFHNTSIIGENYEKIVSNISSTCYNKDTLAGALIYGPGGTGKTRLLAECHALLLKSGYSVLDFTGFDINNDWRSIIREIVYSVFSVYDDVVLDLLCSSLSCEDDLLILTPFQKQIVSFFRLLSNKNVEFDTLRPYLYVLFERLRAFRSAIIIDNVQSYTNEIVLMINELMSYYIDGNRAVQLCILLSLNTSLVFDGAFSSLLSAFLKLKSNPMRKNFVCDEISGFMKHGLAIAFLQTKLRINEFPIDIAHLNQIIDKIGLKPKHLEQVASYLLNSGVVCIKGNQGYIPDDAGFIESLQHIPTEYQILFENNYKKVLETYSVFNEVEFCTVVSVIFLLGEIDTDTIQTLTLDIQVFNILTKHSFLKKTTDGVRSSYTFLHDLDRQCFQSLYPNLVHIAIDYIHLVDKQLFMSVLPNGSMYTLARIIRNTVTKEELTGLLSFSILRQLPNRLHYDFLYYSLRNNIRLANVFTPAELISNSLRCCNYVRDHISEKMAYSMFNTAFSSISLSMISSESTLRDYFSFIIHMAENKIRLRKVAEAQELYYQFLKEIPSLHAKWPHVAAKLDYAKSYIHNRLFVCEKLNHQYNIRSKNWLEAHQLAGRYKYHDILFENFLDMASITRHSAETKRSTLKFLEAGFKHYHLMPFYQQKKYSVNYDLKKIQYLCLSHRYAEALNAVDEALQSLEYNDDVNYHLFFKARYIQSKIIALLASKTQMLRFESVLEDYCAILQLIGTRSKFEITYYKAKYAYVIQDRDAFSVYFVSLQEIINQLDYQDQYISSLMENLAVEYRILFETPIFLPVHGLPFNRAQKVLELSCLEFSEFLRKYICPAPIISSDGIDGYYYI